VLPHPPFLSDLAPCDFFLYLKKHLTERQCHTRKKLGSAIFKSLNSIHRKNAFKKSIERQKLIYYVYHMVVSILKDWDNYFGIVY
jgi:hypothetical protein